PSEIRLLPVSKTFSAEHVRAIHALGYDCVGENKVLEAKSKYEELKQLSNLKWVLIGHLQRNKVKYVAQFISEFHALDRVELAYKLNSALEKENRVMPVFVQVNTSGESSKYGIQPHELEHFIEQCLPFTYIKIVGLMTLAIHSHVPNEVRQCFQLLRTLRDQISKKHPEIQRLSMGMSGDFELAIAEGATDIRIGQAIFGARSKPDSYYWPTE
ncbi:MAG: YggS family pyridoxal phosphate-dependent enzyme, partial [Acinetobacter sp.]|nr:YggS family pyridoxal phosphate-dependent enzyme [Acinetobacter sp.]